MALKNQAAREWTCKVVYYGPAFAGKRTSFEHIIATEVPKDNRPMGGIAAGMPFSFDHVPPHLGTVRALRLRFHLYTISGQIIDEAGKGHMFRDVDGIVFVVDSQESRMAKNLAALADLRAQLEARGRQLEELPLMIQLNKRDKPTALPVEVALTMLGVEAPVRESIATRGEGVLEAWHGISRQVYEALRASAV